jgi:rod shape-determining protein MreC
MPLGTLDRTPPPFFRQGPSALTKLVFFSAAAMFLMVGDARFHWTEPLRAALATVLRPAQEALGVPVLAARRGAAFAQSHAEAVQARGGAEARAAALAASSARAAALAAENAALRRLLDLQPLQPVRAVAAEVLHEAGDPFSRKLFIDRGAAQGLVPGAPVIDARGVLGQVTRVFPLSAEVTLLADKDAAIPVLNTRTQQRGAAFGGVQVGRATMELRFLSANADVQVGDVLHTSGVDGVYPPAVPVATVVAVERRGATGFARVLLEPAAAPDGVRHLLVLEPVGRAAATAASAPAAQAAGAPGSTTAAPKAGTAGPAAGAAGPAGSAARPGVAP